MITIEGGTGNDKIKLQIGKLNDDTKQAIRLAYHDIGKDLMVEARRLINEKPKHGKKYITKIGIKGKVLKRGAKKYTSSAPGEAPAVITGELRKSINFTVGGWKRMEFGIDLKHGNAPYAHYLEYKDMIAMQGEYKYPKPRPFLSGAYKNKKANILENFKRYIAKNLEK